MAYTFNPFTGNFDNTPSTLNGDSAYTTVSSNSAKWESVYSNVVLNSAAYLSGANVDLSFFSISANWDSVYSTVRANSASVWNYQGADLKALSAQWVGGNAAFTIVQANSASWAIDSTTDTGVRELTSNWQNTFTTVQTNSSTWNYQGSDLKSLSSDWIGGNVAYTNLISNSAAYLSSVDLSFLSVSANWNSVYSNVASNSASYATLDFTNSKFFPLTGGTISGATRINGNLTIFGDLSSTGTQTFANTIFSTTSALSVVHAGTGPAVWIGNNGSGDIASFYDIDQNVEILHVGGVNSSFPNIGIKVSNPNKDFTVNGEISANNTIYDSVGNSNQWNSVYSTVQANSSTNWNYQGTDVKSLSSNWQNTYTNYSSNSASYIRTNVSDSTPVYFIRALTQTQYDAISIKDPNTIYFITT